MCGICGFVCKKEKKEEEGAAGQKERAAVLEEMMNAMEPLAYVLNQVLGNP